MPVSRRRGLVCVLAVIVAGTVSHAQTRSAPANRGELVERTMAIVAGTAITLSDVRTAIALGFVDVEGEDLSAATERLVQRALMLREVERYAPQEPDTAKVDASVRQLRDRLGESALTTILASGGFSELKLRTWIRDDVRIATYLDQRFASDGPERRQSLVEDWVADLRRRTPVVELWKRQP